MIAVIGIGNPDRGDDGAGRLAARLMKGILPSNVAVLEHDGEATSLLAAMERASTVYLVDACMSGAPCGTIHRFDWRACGWPAAMHDVSTHGFGLHAALDLGRTLGQLPDKTIVFAIEGASFAAGAPMSAAVADAADIVAERVRTEIAGATETRHA